MIKLVIFDLDGTLVQTEKLKALSYARAAVKLCPNDLEEADGIALFREVVGRSRREVAQTFVDRFNLSEKALTYYEGTEIIEPWQAFVQVRLEIYRTMTASPKVLLDNQWPHNISLLNLVRANGCRVALATMTNRKEVQRVLKAIDLAQKFDFVATRDDVTNGKPDPEIYTLVSECLEYDPGEVIVIEDSPSGVLAAQRAGMCVMAVSTPFTHQALHQDRILEDEWIVDDPDQVLPVFNKLMKVCNKQE